MDETQDKQIPWESSSLLGEFFFHPPSPDSPTSTIPHPVTDERIIEISLWERISQSDDPEDFKAYIRRYGERGLFIRLAQQKLEAIESAGTEANPFSSDPVSNTVNYALYVNTEPSNARVRILNIDPVYRPGIRLNPGRYHIEIAKPGYIKHREWIEMDDSDRVLTVNLEKGHMTQGAKRAFRDPLKDGSTGPQMMRIRGTCFQMGSTTSQRGRDRDERWHRVCVDDFAIGRYEVTFSEYDRFAEATGRDMPEDKGWGRGKRPVIGVSWNDAIAYADWLSEQTGRRYRLPTEAEWEFAARGGTQSTYWWGDEADKNRSNCDGCGSRWDGKSTAPVGSFRPNPFGVYDVTGNVWEWVCSGYHQTYNGSELECLANDTETDQHIVVRGGSWLDLPRDVRLAARLRYTSNARNSTLGFRLAVD